MARRSKDIEPTYLERGNAEVASTEPGEDPTAEDFKPKWLREQEKAPQVPINLSLIHI